MGIPSIVFFLSCFATACAALTRSDSQSDTIEYDKQVDKPTFAILILLFGVYSWVLTLGMHVFTVFFKNGPGSFKYFVTLGLAISSSLFMQVYGKQVIRRHFGVSGGRKLELSNRQAIYITMFVVSVGMYFVWIMV